MFNLDHAIADWRGEMTAVGLQTPEALNELESHLREHIGTLVSAGTPERQAFQLAVARIGTPDAVGLEFNKIQSLPDGYVSIGSILWLAASAVLAILLLRGLVAGKLSFLGCAEIFTLTAGYGAAFLAGGFSIYYVCRRWVRTSLPARQQGVNRAVRLSSQVSAGLVAVGLLLGMFWSKQNLGSYLGVGPREIGTVCAFIWLIALWLVQRFGRLSDRITLVLCIAGNVIISLAWFGAGILAHNPDLHSYGVASLWPLEGFVVFHLFFLVMASVPVPENAKNAKWEIRHV